MQYLCLHIYKTERNAKPAESDDLRPLYLQASLTSSMNAAMLDNIYQQSQRNLLREIYI